jgi:hypothetical protein
VSVQQVCDEPTQVLPINEQTEVIRRPGPLDQLGEAHARHREKTATTRGRMPRSKRKRTGQYILFGVVMMVLLVLSGVYIMMSTPTPRSTEDVQVAMAEPGKWTELLENVELDGFVLNGPWKHDEKAIYSPRGRLSALGFPVKFPDSYRIELVVEPKEPATLVIGLAQHNEPFAVTIDRRVEGKVISGIGPQREAGPLVTQEGHAGQLLAVDRSNLISIQVTRNSIRAICANELVVDTDVPPPTPKSGSSKSPFPQRRMPYLMTTGQIYIHRMSMTALTPATPTGVAEAGNKPVSLLAKVDRSQAPSLRFEPKVDAITTPIAPVAADINYVLPDEYVLEFRVEREPHDARKAPRPVNAANGPRGGGGLAIGLTDHGYPFTVYLNWDRDQIVWADPVGSPLVYGIGYVDDRPDSKLVVGEDRGEAGWLQRNITSTVRVEVAREGITVKVDGTPMVEWKGEASMLWDEQKPEPLKTGYPWLRSTGVYRVSRMTLTPTVTANPTEQTAANTQPLKEQAAGTPGPTVSSAPATAVKKAK